MKRGETFGFRVRGDPRKLESRLAAFEQLRVRLERSLPRRKGLVVTTGVGAASVTAAGLWYSGAEALPYFGAMSLLGPAFSAVCWLWLRASASPVIHPRLSPLPPSKLARILPALAATAVAAFFLGNSLIPEVALAAPPFVEIAPGVLWGVAAASAWVLLWIQKQRLVRMRNAIPGKTELTWLQATVSGLCRELGPDVRCEMTCNPFSEIWSEERVPNARNRPGYEYPTTRDALLRLALDFGTGYEFRFAADTSRMSKIKIRKSKYKGTKYRARNTYAFLHAGLKEAGEQELAAFQDELGRELARATSRCDALGAPEAAEFAPGPRVAVQTEVRAAAGALTIVQRAGFADQAKGRTALLFHPQFVADTARAAAALIAKNRGP